MYKMYKNRIVELRKVSFIFATFGHMLTHTSDTHIKRVMC